MKNLVAVVGVEREPIEVTRGGTLFGPHDVFRAVIPGPLWLILEDGSRIPWDDQEPIPSYVEING